MEIMKIYKIKYYWYEGEMETNYVAKAVTEEQFEKDIIKAKDFAKSLLGIKIKGFKPYLGKGYSVECLPEYYEQIIWYLIKKLGYIKCEIDNYITYVVDDEVDYREKIIIIKRESLIKDTQINKAEYRGKKKKNYLLPLREQCEVHPK